MSKLLTLVLLFFSLVSCELPQRLPQNSEEYWKEKPDLSKVTYEGGDGKSPEQMIIIKNAKNERNGVAAEYAYISKTHGERFTNWNLIQQSTGSENGKRMDIIAIQTIPKNDTITYYFDITDFYGKF